MTADHRRPPRIIAYSRKLAEPTQAPPHCGQPAVLTRAQHLRGLVVRAYLDRHARDTGDLYGDPAHDHDCHVARPEARSKRWRVPYNIGTGIGEVTDPAVGLPMQGMADKNQITTGVESPLYARAFVIADPESATADGRVAIIVADIWSGTRRVKEAVLQRLAAAHAGPVHRRERPARRDPHPQRARRILGDAALRLRLQPWRAATRRRSPASRTAASVRVEMAHANLAPGRIYVNRGEVADCGRNRSEPAYLCNPQAERDQWGADTDREMLLLKFVKIDDGGQERPVGVLNWYPIHPTDRGQKNTLVTGDNKGYASSLFEQQMGTDVSQRGDVRGRVRKRQLRRRLRERRARPHPGWRSTIAPRWRNMAASSSRSPTVSSDRERGGRRDRSSIGIPVSISPTSRSELGRSAHLAGCTRDLVCGR